MLLLILDSTGSTRYARQPAVHANELRIKMINSDSSQASPVENVCKYFKYGYCKYRGNCKFKHVQEICVETDCEVDQCKYRHPRECKFYREYQICRFGTMCCFRHETSPNMLKNGALLQEIKILEENLEMLRQQIQEITINVKQKEQEIELLKKNQDIATQLNEKNDSAALDSRIQENGNNIYILIHAVDDLEKAVKYLELMMERLQSKFVCSYCGKAFSNESIRSNHVQLEHRVQSFKLQPLATNT